MSVSFNRRSPSTYIFAGSLNVYPMGAARRGRYGGGGMWNASTLLCYWYMINMVIVNCCDTSCVYLHLHPGYGRFGSVYRAKYLGSDVAVKIFTSIDENSWRKELEIYDMNIRHRFVLELIAADLASHRAVTQFWLITTLHEKGLSSPSMCFDIHTQLCDLCFAE